MYISNFYDGYLSDLNLDMHEIYSLIGYGNQVPDERVVLLIHEILDDLHKYIKLRYGYTLVNGTVIGKGQLRLEDQIFTPGVIITHAMLGADSYAIFTATIGEDFDAYLNKFRQEGDVLRVFLIDAIGSVLAEATVSLLMEILGKSSESSGLKISNNYSPGYCDWHLSEQLKLFRLLPSKKCTGIHLTDSCLMLPIKSVSGIVAIGKNVVKRPYGCDICNMPSCIMNKKKQRTSY